MFVEVFAKIGENILFNSNYAYSNENYLIKVSDYMRLVYVPLICISSGEDP